MGRRLLCLRNRPCLSRQGSGKGNQRDVIFRRRAWGPGLLSLPSGSRRQERGGAGARRRKAPGRTSSPSSGSGDPGTLLPADPRAVLGGPGQCRGHGEERSAACCPHAPQVPAPGPRPGPPASASSGAAPAPPPAPPTPAPPGGPAPAGRLLLRVPGPAPGSAGVTLRLPARRPPPSAPGARSPGGRVLELERERLLDDAVVHLQQDHGGGCPGREGERGR